ncbi:MAG: hypothetical protein EXX96DRAFT_550083 [Benjaminiella poitrasii]|nr:MAG: hypothetical protein EXX96DRAFT_550083 [Benjaminiella poitrasii]
MFNYVFFIQYDWDVDVIEFWNATLKSYKTCHESKEEMNDPEQVSADIIENLKKSGVKMDIKVDKKRKIDELEAAYVNEQEDEQSELIEKEDTHKNLRELEEEVYEEEAYEEEAYEEEQDYQTHEEGQALEHEKYEEDKDSRAEKDNTKKSKRHKQRDDNNCHQYEYPSDQPPPVPPMMSQNDEALSNLIMSWYYAGYYTGLYQANNRTK